METIYFTLKPKEVNLHTLTLGLARLGLNNKNIDQIYTFKKGESKFAKITCDSEPGSEEVQIMLKTLNKYSTASVLSRAKDSAEAVFCECEKKAPNTKLRIWYDRATYN